MSISLFVSRAYFFARSIPRYLRLAWAGSLYRATGDRASLDKYIKDNSSLNNAPFFFFLHYLSLRNLGILNFRNFVESGERGFVEACLARACHKNPLVIDVGGNHGQFASMILSVDASVRVISFEPNPSSASIFREAICINGNHAQRVVLVEKAVSSSGGMLEFYDYESDSASGHASLHREIFESLHQCSTPATLRVESTTLDDEIKSLSDPKRVCLFKFDIEGHELEAIKGSLKAFRDCGFPPIMIEFNQMNAVTGASFFKISKVLGSAYKPYRLLPHGELLSLEGAPSYDTEIYAYQNICFVKR